MRMMEVAHLIVYNAMMMVMTKKNIMVIMKMMEMMMMKMEMMMKLQRGAVVTMVRPIHICPGYRPPAHSHQKGMNILWICHFVKKHLLIFVMDICYQDLEEDHKNYNDFNESL